MKNCVAYMRYSTDNQTENSIEYQRAAIADYCTRNDWTLLQEFVDEAYSATNDRRPDFQRMMEGAGNNPDWDTIIVYDLSRIFRNIADAAKYKERLNDAGIKIVSVTEPLADSDEGWLTETLTDTLNEYYSRQTRRKTHDGMAVKARSAKHCGGIPPLGYDVDESGALVINQAEAETVKEVFRLYCQGYSYRKMAEYLNGKGYRTKAGKPFDKNSFYHILTQEKYIGTYRWNKRRAKNSKGQHNNHAYKPVEKQIVIEDGCPAIIPLEQFQAVQERLSQRRQGRADTKSRHHYMLGGMKLLKCAKCGEYMVGKVTTSHGRRYTTYACPNHKGGICPTKDIRAGELEQYTAAVVVKNLLRKDSIPQLNRSLKKGVCSTESQQLRNQLKGINEKIDNIVRTLENGYSEAMTDRLHQLERDRDSLTSKLQRTTPAIPNIDETNLKALKIKLVNTLVTSDDPEVREVLRTYIDSILVDNDGVTVNLKL